eukprot:8723665-Alexandrium_andersonii.AAC.1
MEVGGPGPPPLRCGARGVAVQPASRLRPSSWPSPRSTRQRLGRGGALASWTCPAPSSTSPTTSRP